MHRKPNKTAVRPSGRRRRKRLRQVHRLNSWLTFSGRLTTKLTCPPSSERERALIYSCGECNANTAALRVWQLLIAAVSSRKGCQRLAGGGAIASPPDADGTVLVELGRVRSCEPCRVRLRPLIDNRRSSQARPPANRCEPYRFALGSSARKNCRKPHASGSAAALYWAAFAFEIVKVFS
jgi:hypothetical protein